MSERPVIYDPFFHCGGILDFLRKRFAAFVPKFGGDEKIWIQQYVDTRHNGLAHHENEVLRGMIYRTQCFKREMDRNNWEITQVPIRAQGVDVGG